MPATTCVAIWSSSAAPKWSRPTPNRSTMGACIFCAAKSTISSSVSVTQWKTFYRKAISTQPSRSIGRISKTSKRAPNGCTSASRKTSTSPHRMNSPPTAAKPNGRRTQRPTKRCGSVVLSTNCSTNCSHSRARKQRTPCPLNPRTRTSLKTPRTTPLTPPRFSACSKSPNS